jgi:hypothetical protein
VVTSSAMVFDFPPALPGRFSGRLDSSGMPVWSGAAMVRGVRALGGSDRHNLRRTQRPSPARRRHFSPTGAFGSSISGASDLSRGSLRFDASARLPSHSGLEVVFAFLFKGRQVGVFFLREDDEDAAVDF